MGEQIGIEQITKFSEEYNKNKNNKIIENEIGKNGLENVCLDKNIIAENMPIFNIELPECKRYDQKESQECWIFAGINTIKYNIAKNLNIDIMNLELSNNYIAFFDKLEKTNTIYENIIKFDSTEFSYINDKKIIKECVTTGGYWHDFKQIIDKYGIVPMQYMPNNFESLNYKNITSLLTEKVKKDIIYILKLKKDKESEEKIRESKNRFLQENYEILSKILGEPNLKFYYRYKDKDGNLVEYKNMTPIDFKEKFLTLNLDDFISIGNVPMYNKEYYKKYVKKYTGNVYDKSKIYFLNLPIDRLKSIAINQLKDKIPVWIAVDNKKCKNAKYGVMDKRLYMYEEKMPFNKLTKSEALNLYDIETAHAMTFCGVHTIENKPVRWKVEDSYGDEEKFNGYYIMNDNYFDDFVLNAIIDKKYLNDEERKMLEQESIEFAADEPF